MKSVVRPAIILCVFSWPGAATAAMVLQQYAPEKHDRFYVQGSASDPVKDFIGADYDWSGVGGGSYWATMISPHYFVSSSHRAPLPGDNIEFYHTNDPLGPSESRVVDSGVRIADSDLFLGRLKTPVSSDVAIYPILWFATEWDYEGLELFTFGRSDTSPSQTNVRLGRNNIDPASFRTRTIQGSTGRTFLFDFDESGGMGADESYIGAGDSGAPSFAMYFDVPALVGVHWFHWEMTVLSGGSGDTFLPAYVSRLNARMVGEKVQLFPTMGDLDGTGTVDEWDLNLLLSNLGTTDGATWTRGDMDFDGDVDGRDLELLLSHFNGGAYPAGGGFVQAIPEPSSFVLLALGIFGVFLPSLRPRFSRNAVSG